MTQVRKRTFKKCSFLRPILCSESIFIFAFTLQCETFAAALLNDPIYQGEQDSWGSMSLRGGNRNFSNSQNNHYLIPSVNLPTLDYLTNAKSKITFPYRFHYDLNKPKASIIPCLFSFQFFPFCYININQSFSLFYLLRYFISTISFMALKSA